LSPQVGIKAYRFKNPPLPSPDAPLKQKRQGSDRNPKNPKPSTADRVDSIFGFEFLRFLERFGFHYSNFIAQEKSVGSVIHGEFRNCSRNVPPDGENF